ncbi:MAG TPA: HypC/HybG/HupF family hydrogenase formation chaperone [Mycobacteriales bacterium]|nr:HypC/HybG/HupF family hydrogenase formation chaperone [Mycobacteriales bacterium]
MCLAVPGKVVAIRHQDETRMATVDFGGVMKDVCLEFVPDIEIGDYTIVHVGFALQRLDEESALQTLELFRQMGEIDAEFGDAWGRAADQAGAQRPIGTDPAAEVAT